MRSARLMTLAPCLGLLAALLVVCEAPAQSVFKDAPVTIVLPEGFTPVGDGKTYRHATLNASIEASQVAAAYADVIKVFTAEEMATRGLRLLGKDSVTLDGRAALLLHVSENMPGAGIQRWTLVAGDYQETWMVNGTYQQADEPKISAMLRAALLTARWTKREEADPFANFRFSVSPTPKLTFAKELDDLVAFTADGVFPLVEPGDPLLVVGYELDDERITDQRAFAVEAIRRTPHCEDVTAKETNAITLAGLQGYESVGKGKHSETGAEVEVYQLLLFADGYHMYVLGRTDVKRAAEYLPEFKATARSFKLK